MGNTAGIEPLEYKVLIKPNLDGNGFLQSKTGFTLIKPIETQERDEHASMEGELIAVSPTAFTYEENVTKPNVGSTVIFARYSGITVEGADGEKYRLMNDKDVVAVRA
jgi:chaperonin GroES